MQVKWGPVKLIEGGSRGVEVREDEEGNGNLWICTLEATEMLGQVGKCEAMRLPPNHSRAYKQAMTQRADAHKERVVVAPLHVGRIAAVLAPRGCCATGNLCCMLLDRGPSHMPVCRT